MATARAIANGNWSATSTWNGGVVPTDGDTVYANGFNVTLNVDVNIGGVNNPIVNTGSLISGQWYEIVNVGGQIWTTIGASSNTVGTVFLSNGTGTAGNLGTARALATLTTATNTAAGATIGGGVFTMSTVRAMTCDLRAGATTCLNVTATTGTATLSGMRVIGGSVLGAHGVSNGSSATIDFSNALVAGTSNCFGVNNVSIGNITVSGSSIFNAASAAGGHAINNTSTGSIIVNASSTFTGNGSGGASSGIRNTSTGSITINASCNFLGSSGGSSGNAILNSSTGTVIVTAASSFSAGTMTGGYALLNQSTGAIIITNGTFTASAFTNAISVASTGADVRLSGDFLDHWSGWKAISGDKWRLGNAPTLGQTRYALAGTTDSYFTMYGADNGTFGNPIAANVRSGVSYGGGNLTGTCAVPVAGSVNLGVPVDATTGTAVLTGADVATAVWSAVERTLTSASGPTAVQIRQEMDSNSTKLANLDTTVSSRLAPSGTLATVTTLTNAPTVPTAAAIATQVRSELTTELNRLDTNVASRAASGTLASDVTAIKAKTDSLNVDRVNNTATLSQVGNLLAQANS